MNLFGRMLKLLWLMTVLKPNLLSRTVHVESNLDSSKQANVSKYGILCLNASFFLWFGSFGKKRKMLSTLNLSSNNYFQPKSNTRNDPNMVFYGHKAINAACQLSVQLLKPTKFCLVNKILVSPFDDCLQAPVGVQVGSVSLNEPNTRMGQSDIFCSDCLTK